MAHRNEFGHLGGQVLDILLKNESTGPKFLQFFIVTERDRQDSSRAQQEGHQKSKHSNDDQRVEG